MLNFNSILLFSENPSKLTEFYKKVFEKEPDMDEGGYTGFLVGNGFITIGPHDKVKGKNQNPDRLMINMETETVKEDFNRIKELGATVVAEPYQPGEDMDVWIATFADPDGNYFQLLSPWKSDKK